MGDELLATEIRGEEDIFTVRRVGREAAAAAGLDTQDQVRVATALSEVGRELFAQAGEVAVRFVLDGAAGEALLLEMSHPHESGEPPATGLDAAARLMDTVDRTREGDRVVVRLRKRLPSGPVPARADLGATRERLAHLAPVTAVEELRQQNAELVETLEGLRRQSDELRSLNAELEETNAGVLALYTQLSAELEETNLGVVALNAELEEKSDQLRAAGEARKRFWATVSHELRTPINSVIGLVRLLLDEGADPLGEEQRHQITLIGDSGQTLLALVNELLDMARAEGGRLQPELGVVDVPRLLAGLSDELAPVAAQTGLTLLLDGSAGPETLVSDEVMLTRILRNLLANGLKFTTEGEVRLTTRTEDRMACFAVTDTGAGIAPEHQALVFEEFYRVPGRATTGTGLGLPYARRLAEALGGDLDLVSAPGEGTTVTLRLPVPAEVSGLGHVLIVDDEAGQRAALRELVGPVSDRLSEAAGGFAALELAAGDAPDLVLLDLRMPEGDGMDVLDGLAPGIPVVLVTAIDPAALADPRLDRAGAWVDKARLTWPILADAIRRAGRGSTGA
ncbi:hybrid sensor histidine kinase/response regulator [Actinomadura craniellae]|uniref:histidine kinase n=1 Tax=Actinomadura craniellae TaxID=2231787 RepID=A0A365GXJ7_9ACTN|nr:ATP-binding protein [Actinomadura craniellae]RAY11564.1 hybrid sensor histidine kinase/response regulator [Actinomadura craniellae]